MTAQHLFETRDDFRAWLVENSQNSDGIWVIYGKSGGPTTLSYQVSVEEALCFGWIDSKMKSIDDKTYMRYFTARRQGSNWSETNKALVASLEERGLMTALGRAKIEEARKNGKWDAPPPAKMTEAQIGILSSALEGNEPAYSNFIAMPASVKRTYTALFLDAKSEKTKITRLNKIIDRLNKNLKPM